MVPPDEMQAELRCEEHGTATLLSCAQCDTPLCPRCAVFTEVGQKCRNCSGRRAPSRSRRFAPLVLGLLAVAAIGGGAAYLASDAFQSTGSGSASATTTVPVVGIGTEVTDRGLTFMVNSFECGPKELGTEENRQMAAGRYCFLDISVRNTGNSPAVFPGEQQFLIDSTERRHVADLRATINHALPERPQFLTNSQLNPGGEIEGVLVYDVAESAEVVEVEFHTLASAGAPSVFGPRSGGQTRGVRVRLADDPPT